MRLFFLLIPVIISSCTSPFDKKFDKKKFENDILLLEDKISTDDKDLLISYIKLKISYDYELNGITYIELLNSAKKRRANKQFIENDILIQNLQQKIIDRTNQHQCDEFLTEIKQKGIHKHKEALKDNLNWYDDNFY